MACWKCVPGWHAECLEPGPEHCCCWGTHESLGTMAVVPLDTRTIEKAGEDMKDVLSTGRKRAARDFPIPSVEAGGMQCEFAWLANAGGGVHPIVGCRGTFIADIKEATGDFVPGNAHHGPDKSVLNNNVGNVHRICPSCHNRWHALNDPMYGPRPEAGLPYLPLSGECLSHDKETQATEEELAWSDKYWALSNKQRAKIMYRLPKGTENV